MRVKSILVSDYIKDQKHLKNMIDYCDRQSPIFDGSGKEINPEAVKAEVTAREGMIVWNSVFSLSEQDCKRLGVDRDYMKNLIAAKAPEIAKIYNISPEHFRAACSWHDKDFHPHLHMLFWSTKNGEGFIPHPAGAKADPYLNKATRQLKSLLTNEIFAGDTLHLKKEKMERREQLNKQLRRALKNPVNEELSVAVGELGEKLSGVRGRHIYKYLPPDLKKEVDGLLERICKSEPAVGRAAKAYLDSKKDMHLIYASDEQVLDKHFEEMEKAFYHPDYHGYSATAEVTRHNIIIKAADELYQLGKRDKAPVDLGEPVSPWPDISSDGVSYEPTEPEHFGASSKEKKFGDVWNLYHEGKALVKDDPEKAVELFCQALEKGLPWAGYQLGKIYGNEKKELYNPKMAIEMYGKFICQVDEEWASLGFYQLGKLYSMEDSEQYDLHQAIKNYEAAAEAGAMIANYRLGDIYSREGSDHHDIEKAIDRYEKAVSDDLLGDSALLKLGRIFAGEEDYEKAMTYYSAAADRGNLCGRFMVANYYAQGKGCQKDLKMGEDLLKNLQADLDKKIREAEQKKTKADEFVVTLKEWVQEGLERVYLAQAKEYLATGFASEAYKIFCESNNLSARYYKARMEISGKGCPRNVAQGRQELSDIAQLTPANEYEEVIVEAAKSYFDYVEKSKSACMRKMVFRLLNDLQQSERRSPQQYKEKKQGFKGRKQKIRVVHRGVGKETDVGIDD